MSEKILKFGDVVVNKKEFHASKQANALNLVDTDKIVISDRCRHSNSGSNTLLALWMIVPLDLCVLYCLK